MHHIKPVSGRRIIFVLDWSRNSILAKLISDIFRSINGTHARRNGIWTTHRQHYIAAFTWTLAEDGRLQNWKQNACWHQICWEKKNGGSSISTSFHYIPQREDENGSANNYVSVNDAACKWQCFDWFKLQVNGKLTDHLHFLVLWRLSLCLMHMSIRFYSSKPPPDVQEHLVCAFLSHFWGQISVVWRMLACCFVVYVLILVLVLLCAFFVHWGLQIYVHFNFFRDPLGHVRLCWNMEIPK